MQHITTKAIRINGRQASDYVRNGINFKNSNGQLYGHWTSPSLYVVYSYGEHWPLFIYSADLRCWFANEDKTSRTTARHYSVAYPHGTSHPVHARSCTWMKRAAREGLGFLLLSQCEAEQVEQEAA